MADSKQHQSGIIGEGVLTLPSWITSQERSSAELGAKRRIFSRLVAALLMLALFAVQALSLFGYAFFIRQPENLAALPWAAPIFSVSFPIFAQVQMGVAFLAMAAFLVSRVRWRWFPAFLGCMLLSLGSELAGTTYGLPFGEYSYSAVTALKVFDRVPLFVPLSWFFMSLASYGIVARWIGVGGFSFRRVLLASWLLVTWELALDPAMSHLTPLWIWDESAKHTYFGMPLLNLAGWALTGVAIMIAYETVRVVRWSARVPYRFYVVFYLLNLVLPAGIVGIAGRWPALGLTLASLVGCYTTMRLVRRFGGEDAAYLPARPLGRV